MPTDLAKASTYRISEDPRRLAEESQFVMLQVMWPKATNMQGKRILRPERRGVEIRLYEE